MNAQVRLDHEGNAYLVVTYKEKEGNEDNASEDAERLFFKKFNQNGGTLHLVPGKDKTLKMLVVTGGAKRQASVTESWVLGPVEPRKEEPKQSPKQEVTKSRFEVEDIDTFDLDRDGPAGSDPDSGGNALGLNREDT